MGWMSRRRAALGAAGVALAVAGWWLFRPASVPVDVGVAARAPLRVTVDEEGETRVRARYVVAAPTTGHLLRIELDEGDPVERGAVVARIEPAPLDPRDRASAQARLEAAMATERAADADMERARAALAQARRDRRRADKLREAGTLSQEAHETARLAETSAARAYEAARFAAEAADHDVEAARAALIASREPAAQDGERPEGKCSPCVEVRAPVAGQVLRVLEESERIVAAGTPLLALGDPTSLEIVVDVLSTDAVRVKPGALFLVEDWGGEGTLEARVRRVEPSAFTKVSALGVEEQRVNVIADLVEPQPSLGDGYRVEARIVVWEGDDVLQVPASALFRRAGRWHVFVVEGGVARRREVEVGHQGRFDTEILDGLAEGETVILHPSDRIDNDVRVAPL